MNTFHEKLGELLGVIEALHSGAEKEGIAILAAETRAKHEQVKRTAALLGDRIVDANVKVKYLLFDLEATRRENRQLVKEVERLRDEDP